MYGYVRVGAAVPRLRVADCEYNGQEIRRCIERAREEHISILTFPELCVTGYTCGDLFFQSALLDAAERSLEELRQSLEGLDMLVAVGLPVRAEGQIFNCAALLHAGKILALIPKTFLPNHNEFYEERWFSSAPDLRSDEILLCGQSVPIGTGLLFSCPGVPELTVGVEICEDLWCPIPPSSLQALHGANLILNLSASNELTAKYDYRRNLVAGQSSRLIAAYVYASAGMQESTTDLVFGGHSMICENGAVLAETQLFQRESQVVWGDVDIELLMNSRRTTNSFMDHPTQGSFRQYRSVPVPLQVDTKLPLARPLDSSPFVPKEGPDRSRRCREIFAIQRTGLARRLEHVGAKKAVLAVSGGLDSTLALLCTAKACDDLGWDRRRILAVTMPGFGTTDRTYGNALALMESLGTDLREIDIKDACTHHLKAIGHQGDRDVTYENAQARERTQIVMDLSNLEDGLVVGTGDLSELALGFTTYNGDHMSMYNVNCSIPKTLVKALVGWIADSGELDARSGEILRDILDTPVSPELLPPTAGGEIQQKTEDLIGPYALHDFVLYHTVRHGFTPEKIFFLARQAFGGAYSEGELVKWMTLFYRRFFQQQFKRSCSPDGPKVGSVALSPRGDWRMPSDASARVWLAWLESKAKELSL